MRPLHASVWPEISTNVRLRLVRAGFAALGAVRPALAERHAAALFATPRRSARPRPPDAGGLWAERRTLQVGVHRLAVWEWGEGPTVLLVHGWSGHAGQLARFVPPLVSRGYQVVAFDLPGHGHSSPGRVTLLDFAHAIQELGTRWRPLAGIVAHSLGATGTVVALSRGLAAERVVLLAPPAEPLPFAHALAAQLGLSEARFRGMFRHVERALGGDVTALHLHRLAPRMSAPLLLMHDVADAEVPFAHGQGLAAAWPGARLVALERLGHRRLLADPGVIASAVDFLTAPPVWPATQRPAA
jgi:pimeloyl-ACP methyl ester carboxylesterase